MSGQRAGNGGYDFEKRFEDWKLRFDAALNGAVHDILNPHPQEDSLEIPFENAEYRVAKIQDMVICLSRCEHKTEVYHDTDESAKEAFTKEVDSMDSVKEYIKVREERKKKLSKQLRLIEEDLYKKVHEGPNCHVCKRDQSGN